MKENVKSAKQPGPNNKPWSTQEIAALRRVSKLGCAGAAEALGRTEASVRWSAHAHRISLRRPGSRSGLILGQPRGVSRQDILELGVELAIWSAMRERALAGTLDVKRLEEIARRSRVIANGTPLCPSCAVNPQEVDTTGLCRDCHVKKLAEAHRVESESPYQRELWAERQAKVRRRRRASKQEGG